jgi:hypothetical protein
MLRQPGYRHEAPAIEQNGSIPAGSGFPEPLQLQRQAVSGFDPNRALIIWGCFDSDIRWGGQSLTAGDELQSPPGWTFTEPGWRSQPDRQPQAPHRSDDPRGIKW